MGTSAGYRGLTAGWDGTAMAEYLAVTKPQADAFVSVDREFSKRAAVIVPIAPVEALLTE